MIADCKLRFTGKLHGGATVGLDVEFDNYEQADAFNRAIVDLLVEHYRAAKPQEGNPSVNQWREIEKQLAPQAEQSN